MRSVARWRQSILDQTRKPDEIVIVDAFSDDGTAEFLIEWATSDSSVTIYQEDGAAAHGRNFAINRAKFDYIFSTDMGVRLSKNWCEELIKPFEENTTVDVVAGNTCIDKETVKSPAARAEFYIENGGFAVLVSGFVPGNRSVAYKKNVWKKLGGLPEDLTFYADDSVFGRQINEAGYKTEYAPKAMTYWARPKKLRQFYRENFNYGRGDGEALIKVPFAFKLHQQGLPAMFVPVLTGLRVMQTQCKFSAFMRAIKHFDIAAFFMIPVLTFGKGWNFGRGFLIGYSHGNEHCKDCRKRLKKEYGR